MSGFRSGYDGETQSADPAVAVLARWFELADPNECMTWLDLAGAMLAPECDGPLANAEFVAALYRRVVH